jgi:hypothetical protein
MIGTGGQLKLVHGRLHQVLTGFILYATLANFGWMHVGIGIDIRISKLIDLNFSCQLNPFLDGIRGLPISLVA